MLPDLLVLAVLAGAIYLISAPLLSARRDSGGDRRIARVADLEAARDAKYREIRDAELDMRTGKLSDEDYQAVDQTLRAEAIDILRRLDEAEGDEGTADEPAGTTADEPAGATADEPV